jgi:hypothetical protein
MRTLATTVALLSFAAAAHADTTSECIAASEKGQQLRDDHKLVEAREQFLACARDACPPAVKKDCTDQAAEVEKRTPSVVVRAKGKDGQDLVAVHVTSDGKLLTEQLNGQAVTLNPGVHTFRFDAPDNPPIEQQVVLGEGEHERAVTANFGGGTIGGGTPTVEPKKGLPVGGIILGVVGLVGMGVGSAFYVIGLNQKSADETNPTGCKYGPTGCSTSEINDIRTKLVIGDIAFYGGVALLAGGIIWTIVHYASGGSKKEASTMAFDVAPTFHGATATATLRF